MKDSAVWEPTVAYTDGSHLQRLMRRLNLGTYDELYRFSVERTEEFWGATLEELGVEWFEPYHRFVDVTRGKPWPRWFAGGKLNLAHVALAAARRPASRERIAVAWEGEDGETQALSYAQLAERVAQVAEGLHRLGVRRGDRVGLFLPMIPEAVISLLAVAHLGAVAVPMFSGYGTQAVLTRLGDAEARVLITVDGFYRRGAVVPVKEVADAVARAYPGLERVVVVRRLGGEVAWQTRRDVDWEELLTHGVTRPAEVMDPNDPFLIIYTSGTTGKPKGTIHYHGGLPFKATQDVAHLADLREGEVLLPLTDLGWVVAPVMISAALTLGATLVMYEGAPNYPNWGRLGEIIQRHRVTHLTLAPTVVRSLMPHADQLSADLSSLRVLIATGEVFDTESYLWFFREFGGGRLPIINYSGGTEIGGGILGNVVFRPIKPSGFNTVVPGIKAAVLDEGGRPVVDQVGELAVLEPFVGMTQGFWREPQRYLETYWSRFEGVWVHGDLAIQSPDGDFFIMGRSDDTLKVAGKRLGPAEVEDLVGGLSGVTEAAAVGLPHPQKGEELVVVVVAGPDVDRDELASTISNAVERRLGKPFRPGRVVFVPQLPKTRNAKVMRRVIRRVLAGEDPGDLSALENPGSVELLRQAAGGRSA